MPLYEFLCESCMTVEDRFSSFADVGKQVCQCGDVMVKIITGAKTIGATSTKPVVLGGAVLETPSAVEQWQRDNPGLVVKSKTDRSVRDKIYDLKHSRETKAQQSGFKSERDRLRAAKLKARQEAK